MYPGLDHHLATAVQSYIPSISHRSSTYKKIHQETVEALQTLFGLPEGFHIFFHASATEIWERLIQNCVTRDSFHFVNGSFSKRFYQAAHELQRAAGVLEAPWGEGFVGKVAEIPGEVEMINFTHNETSTGVCTPEPYIHAHKDRFPEALITVDMVSSAPIPVLDWRQVDAAYFSVQKCFGLPAGLGVLILNERCIDKARQRAADGHTLGTYHSFLKQLPKSQAFQTVETPNVLGVYLLGKVAQDMLHRGLSSIRQEVESRAERLYAFFDQHGQWQPFVQHAEERSPTVIVVNIPEGSDPLIARLSEKGFVLGNGYGKMKGKQIRIANFPAIPEEAIDQLLAEMEKLM